MTKKEMAKIIFNQHPLMCDEKRFHTSGYHYAPKSVNISGHIESMLGFLDDVEFEIEVFKNAKHLNEDVMLLAELSKYAYHQFKHHGNFSFEEPECWMREATKVFADL